MTFSPPCSCCPWFWASYSGKTDWPVGSPGALGAPGALHMEHLEHLEILSVLQVLCNWSTWSTLRYSRWSRYSAGTPAWSTCWRTLGTPGTPTALRTGQGGGAEDKWGSRNVYIYFGFRNFVNRYLMLPIPSCFNLFFPFWSFHKI